jgi:selenium metabolism protein YedF
MSREERVDARGLACPQPVLETRKAMARLEVETIRVLVDNAAARENVSRMATTAGWAVCVEKDAEPEIALLLARVPGATAPAPGPALTAAAAAGGAGVVVLFSAEHFGAGEAELGALLMRAFVKTLREVKPLPGALIFINGGVRLTTAGSPLIPDIRLLEEAGARVLSCGTCLDFYRLEEKLEVGVVSNMFEIASLLVGADRVVRP